LESHFKLAHVKFFSQLSPYLPGAHWQKGLTPAAVLVMQKTTVGSVPQSLSTLQAGLLQSDPP
jgi:hypothetical protein